MKTPSAHDVLRMDLEALKANPELMEEYKKWIRHPIAPVVMVIMSKLQRPMLPASLSDANESSSSLLLGHQCGWDQYAENIFTLDAVKKQQDEPAMDYTGDDEDGN